MRTHIRCGKLFTGRGADAAAGQTIVIEAGRIAFVGLTAAAPPPRPEDTVQDHAGAFVMPGLIDLHTHISYGDAFTQEAIDLYGSMEYRALRAMHLARKVLDAGYTSIADPACSGLVSPAVRNAVEVGLFEGPRITAAGPALTSRQGLYDWYPSWIGVPPASTGVQVRNMDEAIEEIRRQTKEGVDIIKIALDGILSVPGKGLVSGFNQAEVSAMVTEAHRLGRVVAVHARGTEGAVQAARAGVDLILHASGMDDAAIEAALANGCAICPSLTLLTNNIDFSQPTDDSNVWWPPLQQKELDGAVAAITRARAAGVPVVTGSEAGFAITPCGEWHARELETYVRLLGFTPAEALHSTTIASARFLKEGDSVGEIAAGKWADLLVVDGDPLADITVLQDPSAILAVYKAGRAVERRAPFVSGRHVGEMSQGMWNSLYTREAVSRRGLGPLARRAAE